MEIFKVEITEMRTEDHNLFKEESKLEMLMERLTVQKRELYEIQKQMGLNDAVDSEFNERMERLEKERDMHETFKQER